MDTQKDLRDLAIHAMQCVTGGLGDTFERAKPHCSIGTIGHVDQQRAEFLPKVKIEIVMVQ